MNQWTGQVPLAQRFWPKVDTSGECWLWLAGKSPLGYGRIGRGGKRGKIELAHRIAWELTNGAIKDDQMVCHKCDNPPCVRPSHMFLGTQQDNLADMRAKGRAAPGLERASHGASHGMVQLTESDVLAIRASALGPVALAQQYGLNRSYIWSIRARKVWRHI